MSYKFIDDKNQHVHTLDGQPLIGTSTLIKEVMPPFLAKWGAQCAVDFVKENGKLVANPIPTDDGVENGDFYEIYAGELEKAVNAWTKVRKDAATKGTDMHSELEKYVNKMITDQNGKPHLLNDASEKDPEWEKIQKFAEWAVANIERFIFAEKYTYSRETWTGGIVDCLAVLKSGETAIIDFKSSKEVYFNHMAQVAGYALQVQESGWSDADGSNHDQLVTGGQIGGKVRALVVVPFGAKTLKPVTITNVEGFKETFKHLTEVYKLMQAFKNR